MLNLYCMRQVAELLLLAMDSTSPALAPMRALQPPDFSHLDAEEVAVVDALRSRLALGSFEAASGAPTSPPLACALLPWMMHPEF